MSSFTIEDNRADGDLFESDIEQSEDHEEEQTGRVADDVDEDDRADAGMFTRRRTTSRAFKSTATERGSNIEWCV